VAEVRYFSDGDQAESTYSAPFVVSKGTVVRYYSVDRAGNTDRVRETGDFAVPDPPTIGLAAASDTGISSTDRKTNDDTPTLVGKAEPGSKVTVYHDLDGQDPTVLGTATADDAGDWSLTTGALEQGVYSAYATATDATGNVSPISAYLTITLDTSPPTITKAPTQSLLSPQTLPTFASVSQRLEWAAGDHTDIVRYQLQRLGVYVSYEDVALPYPSAHGITLSPSPSTSGTSYAYRVMAEDTAGNRGPWAGSTFGMRAFQEDSADVTYAGTWRDSSVSAAYGAALKYATASGAKATFGFTGREFAWVTGKGPDRGEAEVWVDGEQMDGNASVAGVQPFDLYDASSKARQVVYRGAWPSSSAHTVEVRVLVHDQATSCATVRCS
jgi:hypothetical protein